MKTTLEFKWTVSRGRDTYGYNICTLRADGRVVARCNGGGYDMQGTCLGNFLAGYYTERLRQLPESAFPEQSHWEPERARVCAGKCKDEAYQKFLADVAAEVESPVYGDLPKLAEDCWQCPTCGGKTTHSNDGKTVQDGRSLYGMRFSDPKYNPLDATLEHCDETFTKLEDIGKTFRQLQKEGKIVDLDILHTWYKSTSPVPTVRHTQVSIDGACGMSSVQKIGEAIGLRFEYVRVRGKNLTVYLMHDDAADKQAAA